MKVLFRRDDAPGSEGVIVRPLGSPTLEYRQACAGARYDMTTGRSVAPTVEVAMRISERLTKLGHVVLMEDELRGLLVSEAASTRSNVVDARDRLERFEAIAAKSGRSLFPFQRQDVLWISSRKRIVNCNEMGLGKSVETLAALPERGANVVVCPAIAKGVWMREAARWRPDLKPIIINGHGNFRFPLRNELVILNYDILPTDFDEADARYVEFMKSQGIEFVVVGDEAHYLKNKRSMRSKAFAKLVSLASRAMLLTGTPLPNKPDELWNVLDVLGVAHEAFVSKKEFARVFNGTEVWHNCGECEACLANPAREPGTKLKCARRRWRGYDWGEPTPEAGERLKTVLVRHLRSEVLPDLPGKIHRIIDVDPTSRKDLDMTLAEFPGFLEYEDLSLIPFDKMSRARALLCNLKLDAALDIAREHEDMKEPLVVFSAHRAVIDVLAKRPGWAGIVGGIDNDKRTQIEDDFQAGKIFAIAATIGAASTAITLTRSKHVYFVDHSWVPADNQQAEDRVCRIGQTRGVIVSHLVIDHPLDAHMFKLLAKKQGIIDSSVEKAREYKRVSDEELLALIPADPAAAPGKKNCRGPKTDVERHIAESLVNIAGMTAVQGRMNKVFMRDRKDVVAIAAEYLTTKTLSDAQWRVAAALGKRYSSLVNSTLFVESSS